MAGVQRVEAQGSGTQTMLGTLTRGRCLDGCYGNTATTAQPFAPSHTDKKNQWSKRQERGGEQKVQENPANDSYRVV